MNIIVITGAAGFLGSHLAEHYLRAGDKVLGLDNFCTGMKSNIEYLKSVSDKFHFLEKDITQNWSDVELFLQKNNFSPKYVFHLASPASPEHYQRLALETIWANTTGLKHCMELADAFGGRVIFASTSEVYGDPLVTPQPETYWGNVNSFGERSCYDEAKRCGEALLFSHNKKFKTTHGLVRIFNTYGPRMNPNDGRVVINFILQALAGKELSIFGDGKQTRSFCYVTDLIKGLLKYAESNAQTPVNLGMDSEFTILELADAVLKVTQSNSKLKFMPLPSDDPKIRRPDLSLAKQLLQGWAPQIPLEEGLSKMTEWLKA